MATYVIRRCGIQWKVTKREPGWLSLIGTYPTRKVALSVARTLAGKGGTVEDHKQ
ncbi:hypothetical protein [Brucella pseudogrignonensis]|uniref:hypothetical protein n=1 Tax=Brucella pseudogrignonensis TaxID=419475 RepID=UPI001292C1DB|nr:hypothetical protein [Brucella pseudogrignonensis]